jgi:hypothetical protein
MVWFSFSRSTTIRVTDRIYGIINQLQDFVNPVCFLGITKKAGLLTGSGYSTNFTVIPPPGGAAGPVS